MALNKVFIMGRLTKDPDVKYTSGDNALCIARFTVAVDRRKKDEGADFIPCVAFGKTAEFIEKYFLKGTKAVIEGRIQTGSYTNKDGQKVYTTDIAVESVEFAESKQTVSTEDKEKIKAMIEPEEDGFMNVPDDNDLPFAMPTR